MEQKHAVLVAALILVACGGTPAVVVDSGIEVPDSGTMKNPDSDAGTDKPDAGTMTGADAGQVDAGRAGLPILGNYKHDFSAVEMTVVATAADGLNAPRDVAVNPASPSDVWIPNFGNSTMVIVRNQGLPNEVKTKRSGPGTEHFMPRPSAMAFGQFDRMATVHEEDRPTQASTPGDFMGPSLWGKIANDAFNADHISHYDMLHNSPNAVGIAWEKANIYWVFDGAHSSITRYDFVADHGPGGDDHSDGVITRCVAGQVSYVKGLTSGLEYDQQSKLLYIADSGNRRIAVLNTAALATATSTVLAPNYDYATMSQMSGMTLMTLASSTNSPLRRPSGIALRDGVVFVSDNETSKILAFDTDGTLQDWLDLSPIVPAGGLMGIDFDSAGNLFVVDSVNNRVMKISVKK